MRNSRRFQTAELTAYLGNEIQSEVRFGFVVSKSVGGAVVRNRVKRQLRAIAAAALPNLQPVAIVIRSHPAAAKASFASLQDSMTSALGSVVAK